MAEFKIKISSTIHLYHNCINKTNYVSLTSNITFVLLKLRDFYNKFRSLITVI